MRRRSSVAAAAATQRTNVTSPSKQHQQQSPPHPAEPQPKVYRHTLDAHHMHHGSFVTPLNKITENGDDDNEELDEMYRAADDPIANNKTECDCLQGDLCTCDAGNPMYAIQQPQLLNDQFDSASTCDSIENIPLANRYQRGLAGDSPLASPRRPKMNGAGGRHIGGYLIAVHRKLSRQDTYFLSYHKTRPSLFGVPLLIPCYEGGSNKDLYCAVWVQVARLLSPLPSTPPDQSNHATDCDDSLGYEFPFTLRAVAQGGRVCALCSWSKFCRGCEIPCNDDPLLKGSQSSSNSSSTSTPNLSARDSTVTSNTGRSNMQHQQSDSGISFGGGSTSDLAGPIQTGAIHIAIDWDPTALHLRYQSTREKLWTEHDSVGICRKQQTEPVDLNHCLRAFTSEEKLEQWYHCAHCKGKQPATKKLQIWKLPPILIIHLKRFNFVNNRWVKSQKVVNFPFKDFDPTPYLASVPQETILRHKELLEHQAATQRVQPIPTEPTAAATARSDEPIDFDARPINSIKENGVAEVAVELDGLADGEPDRRKNVPMRNPSSPSKRATANAGNTGTGRRKRLVSTSLTKTPVIDGEFTDFHDHRLHEDEDPYNLNYRLYAVVSHSGMLNGGHYISYAANPNNSWYCYNDSSCREIPNQPNIDPGSAYLLFYERKGLNYPPYLPNVSDRPLFNGGAPGADIEDVDPEMRKTCSIS